MDNIKQAPKEIQEFYEKLLKQTYGMDSEKMNNNEHLAKYYDKNYAQVIIIHPFVWKHEINGDWFVLGNLEEKGTWLIPKPFVVKPEWLNLKDINGYFR